MKVLATEDVKVTVEEKAEKPSRAAYPPEYVSEPEHRNYVNFSKLVLLVLAITASFLLCLIFAQDLWGQKAEKPEIAHPQRLAHRDDGPSHFPFADDLFENLRDLPFEKDFHGKSDEDEPKVMSKTTKITLRILPSDVSETSYNMIDRDGPLRGSSSPFDDMVKMVMNTFDEMQKKEHVPSEMMEKPSLLSDLPMIFHQRDPIHPKLIVVRKLNPSSPSRKEDDFTKNILDEIFKPPTVSNQDHDDPFPFFPIQQVHHQHTEPVDLGLDKFFPFLKPFVVRAKPTEPNSKLVIHTTNERPESWMQYKHLVSEMAGSIDTLLEDTRSLKELVKNANLKIESAAAPAETTEASQASETDVASKEQPSATPQSTVQQFLKDAEALLNKIGDALTETSVFIKTEDAAMFFVKRTDKDGLNAAIDSFIKSVHPNLDEVFDASTKLTKTNGNEKEIPEDIYAGIVKLGKGLIQLGKIIYEEMADLKKSLDSSKPQEAGEIEAKKDVSDMPFFPPVFKSRIFMFKPIPSSSISFKPEELDNEKMVTI